MKREMTSPTRKRKINREDGGRDLPKVRQRRKNGVRMGTSRVDNALTDKAKVLAAKAAKTTPNEKPEGMCKKGRKDGRLNPVLVEAIESALIAGNSDKTTCDLVGISHDCFFRWLREGQEDDAPEYKRSFYDRIRKAQAQCINRNVLVIQQASRKNWTAAAWFLERKKPEDWARRDRIALGGDAAAPPVMTAEVSEETISDASAYAAMRAVMERVESRMREGAPLANP